MATTYVPIATQTLGSNTTTVTFSSIPSTYTDLVLVAVVKNSSTLNNGRFTFNNDTSALYSGTYMQGAGSVVSGRVSSVSSCYTPEISTTDWTVITANIMNYSNTTAFKNVLIRGGTASDRTAAWVDLYRSTNAISRLDFETFGGNLLAGSTFSLYGVAAASAGAKATGGSFIGNDGTYYYHIFNSSGTFTPLQSLTTDVLVIAGGGGGGGAINGSIGGGGGAGGFQYFTGQAVTATGYSITVGAGGTGGTSSPGSGTNGSNSVFGALTASVGGGGGGSGHGTQAGNSGGNGGSGGGAGFSATSTTVGGTGTAGQGNNGGNEGSGGGGSGGGGAGGAGTNPFGGAGLANSIAGSSITYAIGGQGSGSSGNGVTPATPIANRGIGGDAGWNTAGGNGGSGLVIVRYPL